MCTKANARRVLIHLPHGYDSYATWPISWLSLYPSPINRLVGETLGSRVPGGKLPCSPCCNARTEQFASCGAVGWVAEMGGSFAGHAHHLEKSAPGFEVQAYIAYLRGINVLRASALRSSQKFSNHSEPGRREGSCAGPAFCPLRRSVYF
jgi:hypothetical protein